MIAQSIEHTLLSPTATEADMKALCEEAVTYGFRAVCVPPKYVPYCVEQLATEKPKVVTVVGFPLGFCHTATKVFETSVAIREGADEIDMVIDLASIKEGRHRAAEKDIRSVVMAARGKPVKAIIETSALSDDEIRLAVAAAELGGAAYIKTSTGFGTHGANASDVKRILQNLQNPNTLIKASGGIKTFEQCADLIAAGADSIGTSSGVSILWERHGKRETRTG